MSNEQIIKCTFCQGTGNNPHFRGTCPVCKGKGKNKLVGKYIACSSCRGSGQKAGTTLTCYDCGGLGVVADTRETFIRAREEIREAQEEIVRERPELREKPMIKIAPKSKKHKLFNILLKGEDEEDSKTHFCQCCGDEVNDSITIKICSDCFGKVKELRGYKKV